jgi:fused signal recognition particle receptor
VNPRQRLVADYTVMVQARQRRARVLQDELRTREAAHAEALAQERQVQAALQQARQTQADYQAQLAERTAEARAVRVEELLGARAHCTRLAEQTQAVNEQLQERQGQVQQASAACQTVRQRMLSNEERMRTLAEQRTRTLQAIQRDALEREEEEHADTAHGIRPGPGSSAWAT